MKWVSFNPLISGVDLGKISAHISTSHVTRNIQSECFISAQNFNARLKFVNENESLRWTHLLPENIHLRGITVQLVPSLRSGLISFGTYK